MITKELLENKFDAIGADVEILPPSRFEIDQFQRSGVADPDIFRINIIGKRGGSRKFNIVTNKLDNIEVLDTVPQDRHLLLAFKGSSHNQKSVVLERFLCGHDERDWFTASVKGRGALNTVKSAKEALKPEVVLESQRKHGVRSRKLLNRHTKGSHRQGEWFFIPVSDIPSNPMVFRNEPFSRPRGTAHRAEEAIRVGGEQRWTDGLNVIMDLQYKRLKNEDRIKYSRRTVNAKLLVRGRITHPDHKTLVLKSWHEVVGNSEMSSTRNWFID